MKNSIFNFMMFALSFCIIACSVDEEETDPVADLLLLSCGVALTDYHPSFDDDYMINEPIVISWDTTLCSSGNPDNVSISFKPTSGLPIYRTIASGLSLDHKTDTSLGYWNYIWTVNDLSIVDGGNYIMELRNTANGQFIDSKQFSVNGTYNAPNCDLLVDTELDGDYRIRFNYDNNNNCFNNIQYDINYGDGASSNFFGNSNTFSIAHQYPFGINQLYNVIIEKSDPSSGQTLSITNLTVRAKRD